MIGRARGGRLSFDALFIQVFCLAFGCVVLRWPSAFLAVGQPAILSFLVDPDKPVNPTKHLMDKKTGRFSLRELN